MGLDINKLIENHNFSRFMSSLLQTLLELRFRELFKKFENSDYTFNPFVAGIFYQTEILVPFKENERFFIARVATYYPFCKPELSKFLFHPLASGI